MNPWFRDPRVQGAQVDVFEAERAERRGDPATARLKYLAAGEAFESVALSVPVDHPNTRSDLAIAAVASLARAGNFGRAAEVARRMLAESDALTPEGRDELDRLQRSYSKLVHASNPDPHSYHSRGRNLRTSVRQMFELKPHEEAA